MGAINQEVLIKIIRKMSVHSRRRHFFFKRIIPLFPEPIRTPTVVLHGFKIQVNLLEELDYSYVEGLFDKEELAFLVEGFDPEAWFIDVGANIGFYSLFLKQEMPHARIAAFEPDPVSAGRLKKNIALNDYKDIRVYEYAISTDNQPRKLMINVARNRGGSSLIQPQQRWTQRRVEETIEVECKTLLVALRENDIERVGALKSDIEGYEYPVLKKFFEDAERSIYPKKVVLEAFGHTIKSVGGSPIELMIKNGYTLVDHNSRCNFFFELTQQRKLNCIR